MSIQSFIKHDKAVILEGEATDPVIPAAAEEEERPFFQGVHAVQADDRFEAIDPPAEIRTAGFQHYAPDPGDAMTLITERQILQCTIPFAAGTAKNGAVLTMILPPRGGPATPEGRALRRTAGGRGNL